MKHSIAAGLLAIGLVVSSQAPAAPKAAAVAAQVEAKAIVESIDQTTRHVLLRNEDGTLETVQVGPEVRNLPQVKAGDHVLIRIRLGVLAEMAPADGSGPPVAQANITGRTPAGSKPGALVGDAVRVRITFNSYDRKTKTVSFALPSGEQKSTVLRTKPMQDFAAGLKAGDKVDVTFARSFAVAVVPS